MAQTIAESLAKIEAMYGRGAQYTVAPRTPETTNQIKTRAERQRSMANLVHATDPKNVKPEWTPEFQTGQHRVDYYDLIEGEDY
jgi:hypothetical protein